MKTRADLRNELTEIYRAAIAAVDPALLVARAMDGALDNSRDAAAAIAAGKRVLLLAIGKASFAMATEIGRRLDDRIVDGIAVVPQAPTLPPNPRAIRLIPGGHPLPDQSSLNAGDAALQMVAKAKDGDLVLVALSGGASAMLAAPAHGLALQDKVATTLAMLRCGATIRELNCVRKHLSAIKGGRLVASLSEGVRVVALILSDVPGDDLATIGSGPTAPDSSTFADAIAVLKRRNVWGRAPERVREHLERGVAGEIPETPSAGDPIFKRVLNVVIGGNQTALDAAAAEALRRGYAVERWRELKGEADDLGRTLAAHLAKISASNVCVLAGGEPTVTVRGNGKGGRAQQCALAMAIELERLDPSPRLAALVAGTDGIDGPTDAAGAFVFSDSAVRIRDSGLTPDTALMRNDAYHAFDASGDLLRVGPTGTNVTDLLIGLVNF